MPMSSDNENRPHLALFPSAGMGHLTPFCRIAAALAERGCTLSFITAQPTVSLAESLAISRLLNSFPNIHSLNLPLVELDPSEFPSTSDPFFLRFEAIRRSAHLLPPLLASVSVPISALVIDIMSAYDFIPVAKELNLPSYILFTSSAAMLSFCAYFPIYSTTRSPGVVGDIDVPGFRTVPKASVPPPLHDPNHIFRTQFIDNGLILSKADGILINTFQALEPEAMASLNGGLVLPNLPPVFAVGPLRSLWPEKTSPIPWLDQQPNKSVVYVSFGSRTAMTAEQIKELGAGLERSGKRFLWLLKTQKVDKEEDKTTWERVVGEGYMDRVKDRGLVLNGWVAQEEILSHRAVGGFVSHCGWNSVTEAAMVGMRVLGWPRLGDQRVNGEVVRRSGLGVWMEEWSWEAEDRVVSGEEIAKRVKEIMEDEELRQSAEKVGEDARMAVGAGGSSDKSWEEFISRVMK
nr:C-glycosyltransferase [Anemarrhena asphodeloides]